MLHNSLAAVALMLGIAGVASAQAPQNALKPICSWGPNPTKLELNVYVPSKLPPKPAVILAVRQPMSKKQHKRSCTDRVVTHRFTSAEAPGPCTRT